MGRKRRNYGDFLGVRLPIETHRRLEAEAAKANVSVSEAVRNLIERLLSGEIRLWPATLADMRRDVPSEGELLALAEQLRDARHEVEAASKLIDEQSMVIGNRCAKVCKTMRQVGREHDLWDLICRGFDFLGEPED